MNESTIIILGSSRSNGHTSRVIDLLVDRFAPLKVVDLNALDIGYFDYDNANAGDDFIPLIKEILEYDQVVFASPVYWYTMSAQLKTFFDRISDLLKFEKDLGRRLRGMKMGSISCNESTEFPKGFDMPFKESSDYLGMQYKGHLHIPYHMEAHLLEQILNSASKLFDWRLTAHI